jgi:hypothetical protein
MATVNVAQLRTILQSLPAAQLIKIQAGTVLSLLNLVKGLQGSEAAVTAVTRPSPAAEVDLSQY